MKTFKLTVTEDELRAIIDHHLSHHHLTDYRIETSERIHTLTKRLNKDTPEIEAVGSQTIGEFYGDPRPSEPAQIEAAKTEQQSGW